MVYFLDRGVNLLLNVAGFAGLEVPHQSFDRSRARLGSRTLEPCCLVPRWALTAFFTLMFLAATVATIALVSGLQPTCIYSYDETRPIFPRQS